MRQNKKLVPIRFRPELLQLIDDVVKQTSFRTRTEFVETACFAYAMYQQEFIEKKKA